MTRAWHSNITLTMPSINRRAEVIETSVESVHRYRTHFWCGRRCCYVLAETRSIGDSFSVGGTFGIPLLRRVSRALRTHVASGSSQPRRPRPSRPSYAQPHASQPEGCNASTQRLSPCSVSGCRCRLGLSDRPGEVRASGELTLRLAVDRLSDLFALCRSPPARGSLVCLDRSVASPRLSCVDRRSVY